MTKGSLPPNGLYFMQGSWPIKDTDNVFPFGCCNSGWHLICCNSACAFPKTGQRYVDLLLLPKKVKTFMKLLNFFYLYVPEAKWLIVTSKLIVFSSKAMRSNPDDILICKCLSITLIPLMKSINLDTSSVLSVSASMTKHEAEEIMSESLSSSFNLRKCFVSLNLTVPLPRSEKKMRGCLVCAWFCLCQTAFPDDGDMTTVLKHSNDISWRCLIL